MAPVNRCVRCNCLIDGSNDSEEHIIQNSVGGRLTVQGFICRACNNRTGETWDAVFAKQTNFLSHFFGIVRERGELPPQPIVTTAGERLALQPDGGFKAEKPFFQATLTENGKQIQIKARDRREAEAILRGVARKNPKVDVTAEMAKAEEEHTYLEGMVTQTIQLDGPTSGRSAVKAAVAFAFYSGIPIERCDLSVAYLRHEGAEPAFGYYLERDLVRGRPSAVPVHCVSVSGDPETGMLLGTSSISAYIGSWSAIRNATAAPPSRDRMVWIPPAEMRSRWKSIYRFRRPISRRSTTMSGYPLVLSNAFLQKSHQRH
jgi:HNH endonuclease